MINLSIKYWRLPQKSVVSVRETERESEKEKVLALDYTLFVWINNRDKFPGDSTIPKLITTALMDLSWSWVQ